MRPLLEVALAPRSESNVWEGLTGIEGIFVATRAPYPLGTTVRLHVQLPGGFEFTAEGIADWFRDEAEGIDAPGVGFRFVDTLDRQYTKLLEAFSDYRSPMFFA